MRVVSLLNYWRYYIILKNANKRRQAWILKVRLGSLKIKFPSLFMIRVNTKDTRSFARDYLSSLCFAVEQFDCKSLCRGINRHEHCRSKLSRLNWIQIQPLVDSAHSQRSSKQTTNYVRRSSISLSKTPLCSISIFCFH